MSITSALQNSGAEAMPSRRRWTVADYHCAIDKGVFGPQERLELIRGDVIEKMSQNPPHSSIIRLLESALRQRFGEQYEIRTQMPVILADDSAPEPDIAVVGSSRKHP